MKDYPHLKITGTPFERGITYGSETSDLIKRSILNYSEMFEVFSGINWYEAIERARSFIPFIEKDSPCLLEEMKGIAKGSGLDFEDILTLNSRSELVLDQSVDGCTAFGVSRDITCDEKTYVCQNWDWIRRQFESLVILEILQSPSPSILMLAEAGMISGKGLNSRGIGVCFNALSTGMAGMGLPVHIILRKILDSNTIGDAVEAVATSKRASSGNFLIGNSEGEIINIESAPEDFGVLYADKGYLSHTNHFLCSNLICRVQDKGKVILPDTFHRLGRINRLLDQAGRLNFIKCSEFLADHRNYPDSICRHEDEKDPEGKQLASVYSTIMDLEEKKLWLTDTNPCSGSYTFYEFE